VPIYILKRMWHKKNTQIITAIKISVQNIQMAETLIYKTKNTLNIHNIKGRAVATSVGLLQGLTHWFHHETSQNSAKALFIHVTALSFVHQDCRGQKMPPTRRIDNTREKRLFFHSYRQTHCYNSRRLTLVDLASCLHHSLSTTPTNWHRYCPVSWRSAPYKTKLDLTWLGVILLFHQSCGNTWL